MTTDSLRTRLATPADAAAIAVIYNEGIADRIATFETEPRTSEQLHAQLIDKGDRIPTVVVERDGRVVAWASAGPYRSRPAYSGGDVFRFTQTNGPLKGELTVSEDEMTGQGTTGSRFFSISLRRVDSSAPPRSQ